MVTWHHQFNIHEFEQTPPDSEEQLQSVGMQRGGQVSNRTATTMEERVIGSIGQRNQEHGIIYIYLTSEV